MSLEASGDEGDLGPEGWAITLNRERTRAVYEEGYEAVERAMGPWWERRQMTGFFPKHPGKDGA